MTSMELVGLNTKWYKYQNNLTQEQYANTTKFHQCFSRNLVLFNQLLPFLFI